MSFPWGRKIKDFEFDFDGEICRIVKFHPRRRRGPTLTKDIDEEMVSYHCEEINQIADDIYAILIHWIVFKKLKYNQNSLAQGICRALKIEEHE